MPRNQSKVASPMSKVCLAESDFGRWTLDLLLVAAEGIEPTSLDYRSRALPLSYTAGRESKVSSPRSKVCLAEADFGLWTWDLDVGQLAPKAWKRLNTEGVKFNSDS